MRVGIIAAAGAEQTPEPALGERDAGLVRERLALPDLGFEVHVADPAIDLAEQLDDYLSGLAGERPDVLLYASCLLAVVDDGECFLCLNPAEPDVGDSVRDVAGVLVEHGRRVLMILELRCDDPTADRRLLADMVDALRACVPEQVELIASVRPRDAHPERMPSRLTAGLLELIDDTDGTLLARRSYASLIQKADLGDWPHAEAYVAGGQPFALRGEAEEDAEPMRPEASSSSPPPVSDRRPPVVAQAAPLPAPALEPDPVSPPPAAEPPPPAESAMAHQPAAPPSNGGLRPAPPSERKAAATVSVPFRRKPSSKPPDSLPKVVISTPPGDSQPASSSEPPPAERAPAPQARRPRELLDTLAEGPEAKRAKVTAAGAAVDAEPVPTQRSADSARRTPSSGEPLPKDNGAAAHAVPAAFEPAPSEPPEHDDEDISVDIPPPSSQPPAPASAPKKKPADMTVEDHIAAGDALRAAGKLDEAVEELKRALGKMGTQTTPERAGVYLRIAEVMREQGNTRVAISNYDKALSIQPDNAGALEALIELHATSGNWRAVHKMEERFFDSDLDDAVRYKHLMASGHRWLGVGDDPKRAKERFYQAHALFEDRLGPLEGLLTIYEGEKKIDRVIDFRRRIIDLISDPAERARRYFELGEYCMFEVGREGEALEAFESALETDPTLLEALEVLATALADVQEWGELERVYQKMIDKFAQRQHDEATRTVLAELHRRMALLYRDHLEDPESASKELDEELAIRPHQLSAQLLAADVALELEDADKALAHLRAAAAIDPHRSETYHQLFAVGRMLDDVDTTFLAASVAVQLDAADDRERVVYREHRVQGLPAHRRGIAPESWAHLKVEGEGLSAVDAVMRAVAPAVLRTRVRQLEADGRLPALPASGPQDPDSSTISVVRSIGWACEYLGVPRPDIYVGEEVPGALSSPFAHRPTVLVGREVLSGRTLMELAFIVGRHIALRRPEHELVAHMQSIDELSACFLAALKLVLGTAPASERLGPAVEALAPILATGMPPEERERLEMAVRRFSKEGGRVNLNRWVAAIELCATRAGLLLCGDLDTAISVLRAEDAPAFTKLETRIDDLYAFMVSAAHATLRRELGSAE